MADYNFFVTIVAGENPEELIKPYDKNLTVLPHIVYKYEDAHKLKELYKLSYEKILNSNVANKEEKKYASEMIDDINKISDEDFYLDLTYEYELDENNNAISNKNDNGKYKSYKLGKMFSNPFLTKEGNEVYQARKKDIDWGKMHLYGGEIYEIAWEMVMEDREPETDYEKHIYENMKNRTEYFKKFGTKENYVIHSTAFWGYAYLDENGWIDLDDAVNQFDWVNNFYDRFIKPLPDNTLLTIYECNK